MEAQKSRGAKNTAVSEGEERRAPAGVVARLLYGWWEERAASEAVGAGGAPGAGGGAAPLSERWVLRRLVLFHFLVTLRAVDERQYLVPVAVDALTEEAYPLEPEGGAAQAAGRQGLPRAGEVEREVEAASCLLAGIRIWPRCEVCGEAPSDPSALRLAPDGLLLCSRCAVSCPACGGWEVRGKTALCHLCGQEVCRRCVSFCPEPRLRLAPGARARGRAKAVFPPLAACSACRSLCFACTALFRFSAVDADGLT